MAKRRKKRVAQRGSVNNIILKTLLDGDKYGYEIIKEVEEFSDGKICLKQPSLYSSLGRFEGKQIVTSYWGDSDIGGRRHYYHLTDSGREYYQKEVLKQGKTTVADDDIDDEVEDEIENEEAESEVTLTEANDAQNDEVTLTEVDEDEIPAYVEFPEKETTPELIPDHHFYRPTPLDEKSDEFKEQYVLKKEPSAYSSAPITLGATSSDDRPWKDFADSTKLSNSKVAGTAFGKLRFGKAQEESLENETPQSVNPLAPENEVTSNEAFENSDALENTPQGSWENKVTETNMETKTSEEVIEPKAYDSRPPIQTMENSSIEVKKSKIILDKDGIYKLRDSDYDPNTSGRSGKPTIIDNVIKRTNPNNIYGYSAYTEPQKPTPAPKATLEISDEERKIKNENFIEKFNSISNFKKQEKSDDELNRSYLQKLDELKKSYEETPKPTPSYTPKAPIVTRSILDEEDEEEYEPYNEEPQNNIYNYEEDEVEEDAFVDLDEEDEAEEDDTNGIVDMEPERFEVKNENKQYIEEISNYSAPKESIKINRYENKPTAILSDKTYVLINRVKFVFGLIMAVIMFGELLLTHYILGKNGLIGDGDKTIFIVAYVLSGVLVLINILPIIFASNEHKLNTYKTRYACLFGVLTFLISIILIYCTNALLGFKLSNFEYFATKLIVPAVLTLNFVILPPIYGLLLKSKKFYD